jgi:Zn-dependent peptidase ImmA (M78 family)/transcriptional regulator with XRE-family HTH domain
MPLFNADMMNVARRARGLSQAQLANALQLSQAQISKIETGRMVPDDSFVDRLASLLRFKPSFFFRTASLRPPPANFHRKRKKLTATEWERILAQAEILRLSIEALLKSVDMQASKRAAPEIDPDQYGGKIAPIAATVRQAWMLPRGPIADVAKTMEDAGILIVPFDFGTELIDAFCQQAIDAVPPLVFLNSRVKAKDRIRFSLAHELGHIIMHRIPSPTMEDEANVFAAAFLMPEEDIVHQLYGLSLEKVMTLKMHWMTSMQAIIRRARDLKKMSDRGYKYYQIQLSKRGWRSAEPIEISNNIENPRLLKRLFSTHTDQLGYSVGELADMFGLHVEDIAEVYPIERPRLRLVT